MYICLHCERFNYIDICINNTFRKNALSFLSLRNTRRILYSVRLVRAFNACLFTLDSIEVTLTLLPEISCLTRIFLLDFRQILPYL